MHDRTKEAGRVGRPRKFDEGKALKQMQRQIWTTGLSGASLDGIARSAGLNRPSLAAAFGDKNAIYERAVQDYADRMESCLSQALAADDLCTALHHAFVAALDIYTDEGADGCFVLCTAPAEALTNPACQAILRQSIDAIDALFLRRLEREQKRQQANSHDLLILANMLGSMLQSLALRARAGWSRSQLLCLAQGAAGQGAAAFQRLGICGKDDAGE